MKSGYVCDNSSGQWRGKGESAEHFPKPPNANTPNASEIGNNERGPVCCMTTPDHVSHGPPFPAQSPVAVWRSLPGPYSPKRERINDSSSGWQGPKGRWDLRRGGGTRGAGAQPADRPVHQDVLPPRHCSIRQKDY
ncbi:unnamed protein product [Nezara viridula]|uniref:Uncharacterized protein n=1 Tax=Nezara viridula TaxID=85310 RepID=A0A9P0HEI4_NEZVI|nr:unnamed protein product [Nezara viridula]